MEEQIKDALELQKLALTIATNDKELYKLTALNAKIAFDAFKYEGFNSEEALALTLAIVKHK